MDDFDWDSPGWRDALVLLERQRALYRGAVAEGKEKWLAIALGLFLGGGVFRCGWRVGSVGRDVNRLAGALFRRHRESELQFAQSDTEPAA